MMVSNSLQPVARLQQQLYPVQMASGRCSRSYMYSTTSMSTSGGVNMTTQNLEIRDRSRNKLDCLTLAL
eukprot:SAG25_NODE_319_length_9948_cov_30.028328_3_plen_69_part_00